MTVTERSPTAYRHSRRRGWAARSARLHRRWHPPRQPGPSRRSGCLAAALGDWRVTSATGTGYGPPHDSGGRPARLGTDHTRDSERIDAHGCRKPVPPGVDNHPEKTTGPA